MSPENTHKLMGFYMEGLILGVNTMYMVFCFFKLFLIGWMGLLIQFPNNCSIEQKTVLYDMLLEESCVSECSTVFYAHNNHHSKDLLQALYVYVTNWQIYFILSLKDLSRQIWTAKCICHDIHTHVLLPVLLATSEMYLPRHSYARIVTDAFSNQWNVFATTFVRTYCYRCF